MHIVHGSGAFCEQDLPTLAWSRDCALVGSDPYCEAGLWGIRWSDQKWECWHE